MRRFPLRGNALRGNPPGGFSECSRGPESPVNLSTSARRSGSRAAPLAREVHYTLRHHPTTGGVRRNRSSGWRLRIRHQYSPDGPGAPLDRPRPRSLQPDTFPRPAAPRASRPVSFRSGQWTVGSGQWAVVGQRKTEGRNGSCLSLTDHCPLPLHNRPRRHRRYERRNSAPARGDSPPPSATASFGANAGSDTGRRRVG